MLYTQCMTPIRCLEIASSLCCTLQVATCCNALELALVVTCHHNYYEEIRNALPNLSELYERI